MDLPTWAQGKARRRALLWPRGRQRDLRGYWIGPVLGGVAAALLYDYLFLPRSAEPVDHGAVRPAGPSPKVHAH